MTKWPDPPPQGPLTDLQQARLDYARRDLEYVRAEDLAQLDPAGLILIIATLIRRLEDTISLATEVAVCSHRTD